MRPVSAGDATLFCELHGDPDTMRFVGSPLSVERAQRRFRKILASLGRTPLERLYLVMIEKATRQPIGLAAVQEFDTRRRRVEAGIMLKLEGRGRGFGKEGLRALVTHAFAVFPVDEVWIQHAEDNLAAQRVPMSLGLSRNTEAEACAGMGKCVWSAHRDSWR
jgi:RimJ/RimL family protein N-acetyltransferase